jgi:very-short-patch-repair endonuclease
VLFRSTRTNKEEAKKVAEAVMGHAREYPNLTLGVAAFSVAQMESIQQCMELLRREDPSCESFFNANLHEPFFIKNLENVQGDERDVIFISIGYGRTAEGFVSMEFGPLNRNGGERRLNVLITRARMRCEVFTNLTSDDLDLGRSSTPGVIALKSFLKFAQHGNLDVPMSVEREPDSVFEEMVCSELKALGYNVEQQVGSGGFFIDLAVADKKKPGRYILGIECDGATYHRSRSARDRDRLRQQVLVGLGWQIHRIWSTDWFRNPARELERVVEAIEMAQISTGRQNCPKTGEMQKEIIRAQDQQQQSANYEIPEYKFADLTILNQGQEIIWMPVGTVSSWIAAVVKVESPVHIQEVFRRIADSAGIHRIGNRIETALKLGVSQGSRFGAFRKKGDFLWSIDMEQPNLRDRSNFPSSSKRLEFVAPEEIVLAIKLVIKRAYGMKRDDVPPAVSRIIGFQRTTDEMRASIDTIIEDLLRSGRLCLNNGHLQYKEEAINESHAQLSN